MSHKRAKKIRKLLGYNPKDKRRFTQANKTGTIVLANCTRVAYQTMKRAKP